MRPRTDVVNRPTDCLPLPPAILLGIRFEHPFSILRHDRIMFRVRRTSLSRAQFLHLPANSTNRDARKDFFTSRRVLVVASCLSRCDSSLRSDRYLLQSPLRCIWNYAMKINFSRIHDRNYRQRGRNGRHFKIIILQLFSKVFARTQNRSLSISSILWEKIHMTLEGKLEKWKLWY